LGQDQHPSRYMTELEYILQLQLKLPLLGPRALYVAPGAATVYGSALIVIAGDVAHVISIGNEL
jgi:hypothetical protein